jgi:predicted site-specific integrase-resolvase
LISDQPLPYNHRDAEEKDNLLKEFVAVITSFCCRSDGLRRGRRKAKEIKEALV